ncbi:MAG: cysteine hydrolase [Clostridia bacterium]|nr:cysteine hydrolase [Clostridia bacterium]
MKGALIVVDMQNDFIFGSLGSAEAEKILAPLKARIQAARKAGDDVIFTRDTHGKEYLSTPEGKKLPVPHCIKGTEGHELADGLYIEGAKLIDKPTFGSFELAEYVKKQGYAKVELVGVCTDICVVSNALLIKTTCPETEVAVNAALTAGTSKEAHEAALLTMRSCQVEIV